MQDGIDLITALAVHPETARRLARKFWSFFISEVHPPDPAFVTNTANVYLQSGTEIRPVVRYVLTSPWFTDPVDAPCPLCVAGRVRRAGHQGGGLAELLARPGAGADGQHGHAALRAARRRRMAARPGLVLDVDDAGAIQLRGRARVQPEGLPGRCAGAGRPERPGAARRHARRGSRRRRSTRRRDRRCTSYLLAGGAWTGSAEQISTRAAGLARLLVASSEYQLV